MGPVFIKFRLRIKKFYASNKVKLNAIWAIFLSIVVNGALINTMVYSLFKFPFSLIDLIGWGILHYLIMEELVYFINKCEGKQ